MSQPSYRNSTNPEQGDSPFLTAMLGVALVFIVAAVIVLSYFLNSWYGAYLWDWGS